MKAILKAVKQITCVFKYDKVCLKISVISGSTCIINKKLSLCTCVIYSMKVELKCFCRKCQKQKH